MSSIPLKERDNDDVETSDRTNDNPAKMSECWKNLSKGWKIGIPLIIAGALLIVGGVVVGLTVGGSKQDCSQDGFMDVEVGSEYLKYKIIPGEDDDDLLWAVAQKKCKDEGATMWEVMNEEEWDTIYPIMQEDRDIFWINGNSSAECNETVAIKKCKQDAEAGNGLPVSWPSTPGEPAKYSKYIGGEKDGCMYVNSDGLWQKIQCTITQSAVCVKRKCKRPEKEG